jgi:hypothetical protein
MKIYFMKFNFFFIELKNSVLSFLYKSTGILIFPLRKNYHALIFLSLLSIVSYINTLGHQTANEDDWVIKKNEFVLKGIKSIPEIFNHSNNLNPQKFQITSDYCPLSIVSFAIEQELVGTKHDSVTYQFLWDINGNGIVDPDEDTNQDKILNADDFYARGLGLRHFNNIFFYTLSILLIFIFFVKYLPQISPQIVFLACLFFTIHPIHTEVVANIKSRDEIFSMIFIFLTLIFVFRFVKSENKFDLLLYTLFLFMALLSKEYALLLPIIIISIFYIFSFFKFNDFFDFKIFISFAISLSLIIASCFSYINILIILLTVISPLFFFYFRNNKLSLLIYFTSFVFSLYFLLRFNAINNSGNDFLFNNNIISNPYLLASPLQEIATKIFVLLKYIYLLFCPYPLISDYSFNTISYKDFTSIQVFLSIIIHLALIFCAIVFTIKKKIIAFPFIWYLIFLIPIANFFLNIGATMGERLIFHSSLGFCFLLAWPIDYLFKKISLNKTSLIQRFQIVLISIVIVFSIITINRNMDWENNETLFSADYPKAPKNIFLISSEARNLYIKAEKLKQNSEKNILLKKSIDLVDKGLNINGAYLPLYQTLALDFFLLKEYDNASSSARAGLKVDSTDITLKFTLTAISKEFIVQGISEYKKGNSDMAILLFDKAIKADSKNVDAFYNKAYVLKTTGDTLTAVSVLKKGLQIEEKKELKKLLKELEH